MRGISGWILRWILNFAAILVVAWVLQGFELGVWGAIVGGGFISLVNAFIRGIFSFPRLQADWRHLIIVTLVVNFLVVWLTSVTIKGVEVLGLGAFLLTVLLISLFSFIISIVVGRLFYRR
jgi:uncharacterized membrane protein YvlD (DUF360 family)